MYLTRKMVNLLHGSTQKTGNLAFTHENFTPSFYSTNFPQSPLFSFRFNYRTDQEPFFLISNVSRHQLARNIRWATTVFCITTDQELSLAVLRWLSSSLKQEAFWVKGVVCSHSVLQDKHTNKRP